MLSLVLLRATGVGAPVTIDANQFCNIQREPDAVSAVTEAGSNELRSELNGNWSFDNIRIRFRSEKKELRVELGAPTAAVKWLQFRWDAKLQADWKYLGDAWERGYGDLEWKAIDGKRIMPWYFLASNGGTTHGYGVKTGAAALCYWTADENGITLHADVRCGGRGVQLGKRVLEVCSVVSRSGQGSETPFVAAQAFCKVMCPRPRLPKEPVYGFNDWYCTYGHDTADRFLADAAYVAALSSKTGNAPFAVVDDGWQWKGQNGTTPGLWNQTDPKFSRTITMAELARRVAALGARPGLWYRPLLANAGQPQNWRLQRDSGILDPTVPEVRKLIRATMARFHGWGYRLIKHDYTTFDICGRWGNHMGGEVTADGWAFADRSRTTAEVIRELYRDIREGAGDGTLIIGCNTIGHLAAGLFELQRIGDDTSGREWDRTREMGVNSLAFRAAQHGAFFAVDADCAGQASSDSVPWAKNCQWLDLLAHSGTPLFVSFAKNTVSAEQERALHAALVTASGRQPLAEPLDWQTRRTPDQWRFGNREVIFSW